MKSIKNNHTSKMIIKKSTFITKLIKINNENEAKGYMLNIINEYKGATHYCYAYITNDIKRFSDDGEPSGTAGLPILSILENNDLTNILCVVIRYFGGIKLGAGGLVRAYTKAVTTSLENDNLSELISGKKVEMIFEINKIKTINNILNNINILDKKFENNVNYTFEIEDNLYCDIHSLLKDNCISIIEKESIYILK